MDDIEATHGSSSGQITEEDKANLESGLDEFLYLHNLETSFKNYHIMFQHTKNREMLFTKFGNYRNDVCPNLGCIYRSSISPICTDCLLSQNLIYYNSIDGNFFYYSSKIYNIYLSKADLPYLANLFVPPIKVNLYIPKSDKKNSSTSQATAAPLPQKRIPTNDELISLVRIHREFLKNSGKLNSASSYIFYSDSYLIIAYQLTKEIFHLCKEAKIIASTINWEEQLQKGLSEFCQFLLTNFHFPENRLPDIHASFLRILEVYNVHLESTSLKPFSKLINILYNLSNGNPLVVKQLAIMLAKIYIGRTYLKELDSNNQLNHLTIIISDNPFYVRTFLNDILTYDPYYSSEDQLPSLSDRNQCKEHLNPATEHSSSFLCNKENIPLLIKEKALGKTVNIDTTNTSIENGIFSKLLNGMAIPCPCDNIFNDKLIYRSNSHYIKICQANKTDNIPHDTIFCSGKLDDKRYIPLDDYERFLLVTGFLNFGISLLGHDLTDEPAIYVKHSIPHEEDTISIFIKNFYDDTFDLKKASHSQKDDSNNFADANDMYPNYKTWFTTLYKDKPVCSMAKFKKSLSTLYRDRKVGKALECLSKTAQEEQLKNRYLKNNDNDHRGISGLKFNEPNFQKFLDNSRSSTDNTKGTKSAFESYIKKEIIDKYSPYN
ncbi:MAG: hypothetical protein ABFC57_04410 [Veillonellales bacterium]